MTSRPVDLLLEPVRRFARVEAASGIVLLLAALTAFAWANSPWRDGYFALWQTPFSVRLGELLPPLEKPLAFWVNDGLMAVFFWVVGLEIKRELLVGELREPRRAALPIVAALGGMLVPGAIFAALNWGNGTLAGWAIPTATDIAFAMGVLALLGGRVPVGLKVFLVALAIVDDLGAVLVIALFYTSHIDPAALALAGLALAASFALNRLHVRSPVPYAAIGVLCWMATLQSGVHATVAGVLLALTIPARTQIDAPAFAARARELLARFDAAPPDRGHVVSSLEAACEQVQTPLERLEHAVQPFSAYFVMPVFALANAGVSIDGNVTAALASPVALGVLAGLVLGKQVGVSLASWLAVKSRIARLPDGVTWRQVHGASCLAGIGFTMSLFIAGLAFGGGHGGGAPVHSPRLDEAKLGILCASLVAGVLGCALLARRVRGSTAPSRGEASAPP